MTQVKAIGELTQGSKTEINHRKTEFQGKTGNEANCRKKTQGIQERADKHQKTKKKNPRLKSHPNQSNTTFKLTKLLH